MTKKPVLTVVAITGLAILTVGFLAYRVLPPHYLQVRVHFLSTEPELRALRKHIQQDKNLESLRLIEQGIVEAKLIRASRAEPLSADQSQMYETLMNEVGTSPILKVDDKRMLFYIGSSRKFGRSFDMAYVVGDESSASPECNGDVLRSDPAGECYVLLEDGWAVHYQWTE